MTRIPASLFKGVLQLVQPSNLKGSAGYATPAPVMLAGKEHVLEEFQGIPRILWTYWNQIQPDAFVRECIDSWRLQCPDYEVRLVHPGNLQAYVAAGDLPAQFAQLHPTKQSDWLRLYLVAHHGGFWLDASTLLTASLDWMQAPSDAAVEFVGFYLEKFTREVRLPVIESWAFGARPGSAFITAWQREFHQALVVEGTQEYLKRQQDLPALQQGIEDPHYLLIHITAQKVLRSQAFTRMALYKAEDTAYYYHRALRWKWYLLYPQLCLVGAPKVSAPIVKLRGGERRHFTEMFRLHGGAVPGSIWHRAFQRP
ncbi:capsular polysaccharide synthesis protein [Comamonas sp. w2-DMI]|uniref:glycosyltransferase family 32 protein n=1 Tax=Comamonas sp. w2-DMI TaxID=3126391 RepID=UPI0032E52C99